MRIISVAGHGVSEGSTKHPSEAATEPEDDAPVPTEEQVEAQLWRALGDDLVLMKDVNPPPRFPHARERLLMCRLYLGLIRSLSDDYGAPFGVQSDSASVRAIGIYVFFRTIMCAPAYASTIAQALKLPRAAALHGLQELIKHGYVERVGNAYRATEKANLPDIGDKMQARIDMILETARQLSELSASVPAQEPGEP
jgi:hypothetical protein